MAKIYGATVATPINPNKLKGDDGITPHINEEGFWCIGDVNTGVKAAGTPGLPGQDGDNGITPHIGDNGNWYIGETDTGVKAVGKDGKDGVSGVYVGSGDMPEGYNVQVDPEGDVVTVEEIAEAAAALIPTPKDGYTPQKGVDYFDGKDGYTPQKDVDYFTPADKAEIVSELVASAPVRSVNGKAGAVSLSAEDVGARPASWTPTYTDVGAEKSGMAGTLVYGHNTQPDAHNDIRLLISALSARLDALANSDDTTLDQMAEVVAYIKDNRGLIEQITTGKVSVADIVNNLTTNVTDKPLSAAQGVALKALIDAITVPTKLSELTADATHRLVTDAEKTAWNAKSNFSGNYADLSGKPTIPTVPSWATAASKPSYTKNEVGLGNVDNVKQYSASNPPPYPVTSVNGKTGAVTVSVPTKTSQLTNDSNFADTTKAETWTFTLEDGSTVTKKVVLA